MSWGALDGIGLTRGQMEKRRLAAVKDIKRGMMQRSVARKYGVSDGTASRWAKMLRDGGVDALRMTKAKGAESKLNDEQRRRLSEMLVKGAAAHGWSTDLWTLPRVAELIRKEFGVRYHPGRVWWVLRGIGFSWQKPKKVAREKDLEEKVRWLRTTWPRVKKTKTRPHRGLPR